MKSNRLLYVLWITLLPFGAAAQGYRGPEGGISSHFGVKAGPSLTRLNVSGVTPATPKSKFDPHLGVMYRLRLHRFVFQPELLYARKGGRLEVPRQGAVNPDTRDPITNRYHYVSVPVLLGWIPTEGLTLQAGPEFSYALQTGGRTDPGARRDLGLVVGAHYDFLDMLEKFSLHVRYVYGLNNVSGSDIFTYRNRAVQVAIVYNLYPKQK